MSASIPSALRPEVLFEDTHVLVIDKPAGLLSQGEITGDVNVVDWAREHVGRNYVGLVHRLDRNTSGIMILAKRSKSAERLTSALQAGMLTRNYLAIVNGSLRGEHRWRHFLHKDERTNTVRVVSDGKPVNGRVPPLKVSGVKEALLTAESLASATYRGDPITLLRLTLETGRGHQIRVQAAYEGHPLLGDRKYATRAAGKNSAEFGRPALHSYRLVFPHPMTDETHEYCAPVPKDMRECFPDFRPEA